jgi:hypothetical protein
MTVGELLDRISAAELVEWRAYDQLGLVDSVAPAPLAPRAAMNYERLQDKLDRFWQPEP